MKHQTLFLGVLCILLSCCKTPHKSMNTITGTIEGLKPDDKFWVVVNDTFYNGWFIADTISVTHKDHFTYSTFIKDKPVFLSYIPAQEVNNPEYLTLDGSGIEIFLEGYADISLSGNINNWRTIYPEGGLYRLPAMQPLNKILKEAYVLRAQSVELMEKMRRDESQESAKEAAIKYAAASKKMWESTPLKREFYRNNPDKTYSAYLLYQDDAVKQQKFPDYEETFQAFTPPVKATEAGAKIAAEMERLRVNGVGAVMKEFDFPSLDGSRVKLSDYRGKYVMIDFWASWCGPCRQASPAISKLYHQFKDREDFEVIGVACNDSEPNWRKAVEEDKPEWVQLFDDKVVSGTSVMSTYNFNGIPMCFFLGPDGKILLKGHPLELVEPIPGVLTGTADKAL